MKYLEDLYKFYEDKISLFIELFAIGFGFLSILLGVLLYVAELFDNTITGDLILPTIIISIGIVLLFLVKVVRIYAESKKSQ